MYCAYLNLQKGFRVFSLAVLCSQPSSAGLSPSPARMGAGLFPSPEYLACDISEDINVMLHLPTAEVSRWLM
jgi:hypothetical protein